MDKSIPKTVEVLKDLIKVNQDRIEAYSQAASKFTVHDIIIESTFLQMMENGKSLAAELTTEMIAHGEQPAEAKHVIGAVYREWMDINLLFNGTTTPEILDFFEYIEDAIVMVYDNALLQEDITETAHRLLERQKNELVDAYMKIKQLKEKELSYY